MFKISWWLILPALAGAADLKFRAQEIAKDLGVVYAVTTGDVNGDRKPDIVAISPTHVLWFENPAWTRHVILDGSTKKDNVCIAGHDIDRDGKLDFAVGADWQATNTQSGGSLQWIRRDPRDAAAAWQISPLPEEPTLHRIRWGDVDGDRKPELVVAPLHGRGTKGPKWEGRGARILVYRVPKDPVKDPWPVETADDSLHIVHNFIVTAGEIWTASAEGVFALRRGRDGKWSKRQIGEGAPGEIKLGRAAGKRYLATVEPWHGNSIIVYEEQPGLWKRTAIETGLAQAHALGWADFDRDGHDDLAVGWRGKPYGVAVFRRSSAGGWVKAAVDSEMAAEDIAVEDLDGDKRPEIIAGGRATQNIRIYWPQ